MSYVTRINGRPKRGYSRVECLRGDAGHEMQEFMVAMIDRVGTSGGAEEERLYRSLKAERVGNSAEYSSTSLENERMRLRAELLKRL